jgi:hypothetical protein
MLILSSKISIFLRNINIKRRLLGLGLTLGAGIIGLPGNGRFGRRRPITSLRIFPKIIKINIRLGFNLLRILFRLTKIYHVWLFVLEFGVGFLLVLLGLGRKVGE